MTKNGAAKGIKIGTEKGLLDIDRRQVMRTVQLLDPTAKPHDDEKPLAQRHADLRGKRVGILDNTKSNADVLMQRIAAMLCEQHGASEVIYRRKAHAAIGATSELLDEMAESCDLVLLGSGD
jgi:hypothetical protein